MKIRSSKTTKTKPQPSRRPLATFIPQDAYALASVLDHYNGGSPHVWYGRREIAVTALHAVDYLAFDHDITVADHARASGIVHAMLFVRSGSSEEVPAEARVARSVEALRLIAGPQRTPATRYAADVGRAFFIHQNSADLAWAICEAAAAHLGWAAMDCMIDMGAGEIPGGTPEAHAREASARPIRAVA